MKRRFPDTAHGQIIAILIGSLMATFALVFVFLKLTRPDIPPLPPGPWPGALRIAAVIEALHAAPPEARASIAQAVSNDHMRVQAGSATVCSALPPSGHTRHLQLVLESIIKDRFGTLAFYDCAGPPGEEDTTRIEVPLDGVAIDIQTHTPHEWSQIIIATLPLTVAVSFLLILIVSLSLWALWRINHPLRQMADTVEQFGLDVKVAPLPEKGPREFRRLARTFNRMEHRITQLLNERSSMLMAVGHDLRTPLTRLRLRIELDEALASRKEVLRELDLMQKMINGALSFMNNRHTEEAFEEVDLGAMVESICIEFAESRKDVVFTGEYGLNHSCQPTAMTRAINNLIENGCRYGTHVVVNVRREDQSAIIDISDDGPGIPAEKREMVMKPFARLDPARASNGGLGLGLSIARDVFERHGAGLALMDAVPRGLLVRIRLPFRKAVG